MGAPERFYTYRRSSMVPPLFLIFLALALGAGWLLALGVFG